MTASWRAAYGAHPLHLLAVLGALALAGSSAVLLADAPGATRMLVWFLGALLLADLVLLPITALGDRALRGALARRRQRVPVLNHVRLPLLGSLLLLLVFFPGIARTSGPTYVAATGLTQEPYLQRWLLLSGAMVLVSALAYAVRYVRAEGRR